MVDQQVPKVCVQAFAGLTDDLLQQRRIDSLRSSVHRWQSPAWRSRMPQRGDRPFARRLSVRRERLRCGGLAADTSPSLGEAFDAVRHCGDEREHRDAARARRERRAAARRPRRPGQRWPRAKAEFVFGGYVLLTRWRMVRDWVSLIMPGYGFGIARRTDIPNNPKTRFDLTARLRAREARSARQTGSGSAPGEAHAVVSQPDPGR